MRTMLISLVCFFFLSQLAIALTPPLNPKQDFNDLECGTTFVCYAPEICTDGDLDGKPISDGSVVKVLKNTPISNDCPALIRFHQYTKSKVHVEIESFRLINEINDITFVTFDSSSKEKAKFSCTYDSSEGRIIGKHYKAEKYDADTIPEKLKCSFETSKEKDKNNVIAKVFGGEARDKMQFKLNNGETKIQRAYILDLEMCDPQILTFEEASSSTMVYYEVKHIPGKFYCEQKYYEKEFRLSIAKPWERINGDIVCDDNQYKINGDLIPTETKIIYVRCFLKASYLCNYRVKWNNEQKEPEFTHPDPSNQKETLLKCPSDHPHLVIVSDDGKRIRDQFKNAKFECKNYGDDQVWTVNNEQLTKEGPMVYCTNKLRCDLIKTIPDTAVGRGYVGGDLLPTCFDDGDLKVGNDQVSKVRCDPSTGHYEYSKKSGGDNKTVDENTKFHCDYPVLPNTEQNTKDAEKIWMGTYIAGGVTGAIFLGIALVFALCLWRSIKKDKRDKKKAKIERKRDFLKFAATKEEISAENAKQQQSEEKMSKREKARDTWNALTSNFLFTASSLSTNQTPSSFEVSRVQKKSTFDTKDGFGGAFMSKVRKLEKYKEKYTEPDSHIEKMRKLNTGEYKAQKTERIEYAAMKYWTDEKYRNIPMNTPKKG